MSAYCSLHGRPTDSGGRCWKCDLERYACLERDWDSYGAPPISPRSLRLAGTVIRTLERIGMRPPTVVPTSAGRLQLEWSALEVSL